MGSVAAEPSPAVERWKPIAGTGELYEASDLGRVRRVKPSSDGRPLGPDNVLAAHRDRRGCLMVTVRGEDGRQELRTVAACVLMAFVGSRPSHAHRAAYVDGDPSNLRPVNLAWQTPLENHDAARANGRVPDREVRTVGGRPCHLCRRCGIWQPVAEFPRLTQTYSKHGRPNSKCELQSECRACNNERRVERKRLSRLNGGRMPTPAEKVEPLLRQLDTLAGADNGGAGLTPAARATRARQRAGLSRSALARLAGLKPATVDNLENGVRLPRPDTVRRLVDALRRLLAGGLVGADHASSSP